MFISDYIEIKLNNPSEEFTLGIHQQRGDAIEIDKETGEIKEDTEVRDIYRLIFGFLFFNVIIYW